MSLTPPLPGIAFEVLPRALDDALPRMDVCGFVGFASRGPVDVPVVVEDPVVFRDVFGPDPVVAHTDDGSEVRGLLGSAVEAFFANGGARAWIVRVARSGSGGALTNTFVVPGLLVPGPTATDISGWRLASLAARSPGAWSDGLSVGATLTVTSTVATSIDSDRVVVDHTTDITRGDLIQIGLADGADLVATVSAVTLDTYGKCVTFDAGAGWRIAENPALTTGDAYRLGVDAAQPVSGFTVEAANPELVDAPDPEPVISVDGAASLRPDDVVVVVGAAPGRGLTLLTVGEERAGSVGTLRRHFSVAGSWAVADAPADWLTALEASAAQVVVEVQRLRLTVRNGAAVEAELDGLGFGQHHPRAAAAVPSDDQLYTLLARMPRARVAGADPADLGYRSLTPLERETLAPRFPLAGAPAVPLMLPLGVPTDPSGTRFGPTPGEADTAPAPERNGLGRFDAGVFVDPAIAGLGVDTIMPTAWDLSYVQDPPRRLRGVHALATNDDITLICVPDAVHTGWQPAEVAAPAPLTAPVLHIDGLDNAGAHLTWSEIDTASGYDLEHDDDLGWGDPIRTGVHGRDAVLEPQTGCPHLRYVRVRARRGDEVGPWSNTAGVHVPATTFVPCQPRAVPANPAEPPPAPVSGRVAWRARTPAEASPWNDLRAVQTAVLRWCAARGDVLAVLAMPSMFTVDDAVQHVRALRSTTPSFDDTGLSNPAPVLAGGVPALTDGESGVLGYGALYHPWPVVGRPDAGGLRAVSPDGGIAGTYAARARAHGAWIAPARMPLTAVLALAPTVEADGLASMVGAAINPVAADPSGHMALTAATMTDVAAIRPVNVRRLVMLLRRLARRDGAGIVFEPNDRTLQRLVRMRFERLLTAMFHRGAFAGAVPAEAFEVSTGGGVNSAASIDAGRFVVEIRFAPSRPLEFITVRLVLAGTDRGEESV